MKVSEKEEILNKLEEILTDRIVIFHQLSVLDDDGEPVYYETDYEYCSINERITESIISKILEPIISLFNEDDDLNKEDFIEHLIETLEKTKNNINLLSQVIMDLNSLKEVN